MESIYLVYFPQVTYFITIAEMVLYPWASVHAHKPQNYTTAVFAG